jgi:hypothetical protein
MPDSPPTAPVPDRAEDLAYVALVHATLELTGARPDDLDRNGEHPTLRRYAASVITALSAAGLLRPAATRRAVVDHPDRCPTCGGSGNCLGCLGFREDEHGRLCDRCNATGDCVTCAGSGATLGGQP